MVTYRAWYPLNARSININALDCKQIDLLNAMQKNQCINDYVKITFHDEFINVHIYMEARIIRKQLVTMLHQM